MHVFAVTTPCWWAKKLTVGGMVKPITGSYSTPVVNLRMSSSRTLRPSTSLRPPVQSNTMSCETVDNNTDYYIPLF